ncbi:MAG: sulfite exporter TauE/SafE family protein [Gammaproteobacteria bacterium]|nr:sulfite exporter TauE/SafE family protein [Gammaproteobacteria bacterium]MCB1852967.1 sulfite exporter TauE/SafE family protein [Gammaproteobacteria bacterium]
MDLTTLLIAGAAAGIAAGLLGIGGGVIIVPVLSLVFAAERVDPDILIKVAVGTSLATISVTAVSSLWAHHRRGAVSWDLVKVMTPGIVAGSAIGAILADVIPGYWLTVAFVIFLLAVSAQMAWGPIASGRDLPGPWGVRFVATGVGTVSALMGVGGGALNVPFLSWCGVPVKRAIATAAAVGFPLAVASTIGFIVTGLDETRLPLHCLGYVNLPAFGGIVAASFLFAPLGARIAHALPERILKRTFAVFLSVLALRMIRDLLTGT